jgi:hypothetical protein
MSGMFAAPDCGQRSEQRLKDFRDGKKTFCQLTELERFIVCPLRRSYERLYSGGSLMLYTCNMQTAYVDAIDLSKESKIMVDERLGSLRNQSAIVEHCKGSDHIVYKLSRKDND